MEDHIDIQANSDSDKSIKGNSDSQSHSSQLDLEAEAVVPKKKLAVIKERKSVKDLLKPQPQVIEKAVSIRSSKSK